MCALGLHDISHAISNAHLVSKAGSVINGNFHSYLTMGHSLLGVDRYVFFRADADTDYYRSSRPITDILNRYTYLV